MLLENNNMLLNALLLNQIILMTRFNGYDMAWVSLFKGYLSMDPGEKS